MQDHAAASVTAPVTGSIDGVCRGGAEEGVVDIVGYIGDCAEKNKVVNLIVSFDLKGTGFS